MALYWNSYSFYCYSRLIKPQKTRCTSNIVFDAEKTHTSISLCFWTFSPFVNCPGCRYSTSHVTCHKLHVYTLTLWTNVPSALSVGWLSWVYIIICITLLHEYSTCNLWHTYCVFLFHPEGGKGVVRVPKKKVIVCWRSWLHSCQRGQEIVCL